MGLRKKQTQEDGTNTRTISLLLTESCNLSCVYCYEHNKSSSKMTFEKAKKILDHELRDKTPKENTYIDFFGGEPFLNFELMKHIYDYVMSFYKGKIHFFASTNGTLIHEEIQEWLIKNKKYVSIGLSLDGTREAHNINRSNSFDDIDLDFFLKQYPEQSVKMTVSEQSLPYFAESVKYLSMLGFKVACNLAYMIDWMAENNKTVLIDQLNQLIDFYIENPHIERCTMLDFHIEALSRPELEGKTMRKYCGTGTAMVCYDLQGNAYPCQLFTPLSAGDKAKKLEEISIEDEFDKTLLDNRCQNCYYLRICPICMGSNYLSTGNLYKPDYGRCELYKLIFAANAKLKALEWDKGLLHFEGDEEQALLRSIAKIQELQ